MATYTAYYRITNITHVTFEAENEEEAKRIAEQMEGNGSVLEEFGYDMCDLSFSLNSIVEE